MFYNINHAITESFDLEGTLRDHLAQHPCSGQTSAARLGCSQLDPAGP